MKCPECSYEAPVPEFRYLYNVRIDAPLTLRQCPQCQAWLSVDELAGESTGKVDAGDAPWGKSAGIDRDLEEAV